jgi:hypothetical protein
MARSCCARRAAVVIWRADSLVFFDTFSKTEINLARSSTVRMNLGLGLVACLFMMGVYLMRRSAYVVGTSAVWLYRPCFRGNFGSVWLTRKSN